MCISRSRGCSTTSSSQETRGTNLRSSPRLTDWVCVAGCFRRRRLQARMEHTSPNSAKCIHWPCCTRRLCRSNPSTGCRTGVNTWFARVSGANGKIDVTELVCPGRATDFPGTDGLARLRVRTVATIIEKLIFRDTGPVNVQASAMVNVLKVAPGRRTVLAPASDAKVRFITVVNDPPATGQEVAGWQRCPSLY